MLLLILPMIAAVFFLMRFRISGGGKKLKLEGRDARFGKHDWILFFSRVLIFSFLLIAVAYPFVEDNIVIQGDPHLVMLIDNSSSMSLFNLAGIDELRTKLGELIPVEASYIASGDVSALGDGVLRNVHEGESLLLVSDGNNNYGADLGDAALYAASLNATVNAIKLKENVFDASVSILGPEKTLSGVDNTLVVHIDRTFPKEVQLAVFVDGTKVIDKINSDEYVTFTSRFENGYHEVSAHIIGDDEFVNNNWFYKTVKVVDKPKVLFVSEKESPLSVVFAPLYQMDGVSSLNDMDIESYGAVVLNDIRASHIMSSDLDKLGTFVADGNGLAVFGGQNSYDGGDYKGSRLEQMLPVAVAKAGKKAGRANIVVVIDISGSTGHVFEGDKAVDVEKAMAVSILDELGSLHRVGVAAFNTESYNVADVSVLRDNKAELVDKISRLKEGGGTQMHSGILLGAEMLKNFAGDKNLIVISDGKTQEFEKAISAVREVNSQGVRVYTVGVGGDTNEEYMNAIASYGGGAYFRASGKSKLKLLFGEVQESGDRKMWPLAVLDENHFITSNLKLSGVIYGYNQAVPKSSAQLLVSTDVGDPIVTVWRYGLGRVVSLTTDDGSVYAPDLVNKDNSRLLTRSVNYAVGDPERKLDSFVDIADVREGESVDVYVKSPEQPVKDGVGFLKLDKNIYKAVVKPDHVGFNQFYGAKYAVSYKKEFEDIGMNPQLEKIVESTGGKMFDAGDVDKIVEHVRVRSRRVKLEKINLAWIFIVLAIVVYLLEIGYRKVFRGMSENFFSF